MTDRKDLFEKIKELIRVGQHAEARALLLSLGNDPKAQDWLIKLDKLSGGASQSSTPAPVMDEKAILVQTRQLLSEQKYQEARALLYTIPQSAKAQDWLRKIDQLDPPVPSQPAPSNPPAYAAPVGQPAPWDIPGAVTPYGPPSQSAAPNYPAQPPMSYGPPPQAPYPNAVPMPQGQSPQGPPAYPPPMGYGYPAPQPNPIGQAFKRMRSQMQAQAAQSSQQQLMVQWVVGGIGAFMMFAALIYFVAFPWLSWGDSQQTDVIDRQSEALFDSSNISRSAAEEFAIELDDNNCAAITVVFEGGYCIVKDTELEPDGGDTVLEDTPRFLEILLLPFAGLILLGLAMSVSMLLPVPVFSRQPSRRRLTGVLLIGLVVGIFPLIWQELYIADFKGTWEDYSTSNSVTSTWYGYDTETRDASVEATVDIFRTSFSTTPVMVMGWITFFAAITGILLNQQERRNTFVPYGQAPVGAPPYPMPPMGMGQGYGQPMQPPAINQGGYAPPPPPNAPPPQPPYQF